LTFKGVSKYNPNIERSADLRFTGPRPSTDTPRPKGPAIVVFRGFAVNPPDDRNRYEETFEGIKNRGRSKVESYSGEKRQEILNRVRLIVVIGGVIMMMAALVSATQERIESPGDLMLQLSREPKLGETVTLTATFTATENIDFLRVEFQTSLGAKIVDGQSRIDTKIAKGETKSFVVQVLFTSAPAHVHCGVAKCVLVKNAQGKEEIFKLKKAGRSIWRHVVDQKTKQLGTEEERNRKFGTEFPEKTDYPLGIQYGRAPQNRNLIQLFLQDEPKLTKLEALWLVDKAEQSYCKDPWAHENSQSAKEREPDGTPSVFHRAVERVIGEAKLKSKQTGKTKIIIYREISEEWKRVRKPD
jgi:hypothetical protein